MDRESITLNATTLYPNVILQNWYHCQHKAYISFQKKTKKKIKKGTALRHISHTKKKRQIPKYWIESPSDILNEIDFGGWNQVYKKQL